MNQLDEVTKRVFTPKEQDIIFDALAKLHFGDTGVTYTLEQIAKVVEKKLK